MTWSYEVRELSEGFSAIVYDEHDQAIAQHLTEERARLIAAAPDMLAALRVVAEDPNCATAPTPVHNLVLGAIAKAVGDKR